jgi:hypothetical protein
LCGFVDGCPLSSVLLTSRISRLELKYPFPIVLHADHNPPFVAIGAKILQHLLHRLVGQFSERTFPAWVLGSRELLLHFGLKLIRRDAGERGREKNTINVNIITRIRITISFCKVSRT